MDPKDPTNRFVIAAGGITISQKLDLFLKKKTQSFADTDVVEIYDFSQNSWVTFNARLSIARHLASICELKGNLYVIGGHKVELPNEFICSIEQCPIRCQQSSFHLLRINYSGLDLRIQTLLAMPLLEDDGIMIVSDYSEGSHMNQGFFVDLKCKAMKKSRFYH